MNERPPQTRDAWISDRLDLVAYSEPDRTEVWIFGAANVVGHCARTQLSTSDTFWLGFWLLHRWAMEVGLLARVTGVLALVWLLIAAAMLTALAVM